MAQFRGGARGGVGGGGVNNPTHERIHSAKIELFGYGPNYQIELSALKPNVKKNIKLNTSKSQVNRYHVVLY